MITAGTAPGMAVPLHSFHVRFAGGLPAFSSNSGGCSGESARAPAARPAPDPPARAAGTAPVARGSPGHPALARRGPARPVGSRSGGREERGLRPPGAAWRRCAGAENALRPRRRIGLHDHCGNCAGHGGSTPLIPREVRGRSPLFADLWRSFGGVRQGAGRPSRARPRAGVEGRRWPDEGSPGHPAHASCSSRSRYRSYSESAGSSSSACTIALPSSFFRTSSSHSRLLWMISATIVVVPASNMAPESFW